MSLGNILSYLLLGIAGVGTLASTVFLGLAILAAIRHKQRTRTPAIPFSAWPGVSILKPLHGMEPRLEQNLESFFHIDYPEFELLFCARASDDPGLKLAAEIAARHPQVRARILTAGEPPWPNAKVYSLTKMLAAAQHEHVVISDSDVEVQPAYLREIAPQLAKPSSGVITCLYRGLPIGGLWSRLEALGMSVEMTSGVLIADMLEGVKFALGPTMATRKAVIAKLGGLEQLGSYASDDYVLGNLVDAAGFKNWISPHIIDHIVTNRSFVASWRHQVRWMKTTRYSRPKGHFGTGLTFAVPYGVLGLIGGIAIGNLPLGFALLGWSVANRLIQTIVVGWGVVRDPRALSHFWLYPLRDLLGFFLWLASYGSNVIEWRGQEYRMEAGGKMTTVTQG